MNVELVFEKGSRALLMGGNNDSVNIDVLGKLDDPKSLYSLECTRDMQRIEKRLHPKLTDVNDKSPEI